MSSGRSRITGCRCRKYMMGGRVLADQKASFLRAKMPYASWPCYCFVSVESWST